MATVAQITGVAVSAADPDNTPSYGLYSCNYTNADQQISISIVSMDGLPGYDANKSAHSDVGSAPQDVSGIGDQAFTTNGPSDWLEAVFGDTDISVTGLTTVSVDQAKQLIGQLHSQM